MVRDLYDSIKIAKMLVYEMRISFLDPGIGFAKTHEQNLEAMRNLEQLKTY